MLQSNLSGSIIKQPTIRQTKAKQSKFMELTLQAKENLQKKISSMHIKNEAIKIMLDSKANDITDSIYEKCKDMNIDWFIAIVGGEGSGKSTLALNLFAKFAIMSNYPVAETLLRTLIYDEDELLTFISSVNPKEKFLPIFLDEGANILFNRESMNTKRSYILKFFNVMRFLNCIVLICTPNIKFLDKNVRTHRIKSIFYIPQRGVYWYYDRSQIERMLQNETNKSWKWIEPRFAGTFSVNPLLESITTIIKENYVSMFSARISEYLKTLKSTI